MKKLTNYAFALLMGAIMFSACKEKTFEPENFVVVEENQVPNGTVTFTLSVHVIPSSKMGRVSGLSGATVTINNAGGIATVITGADGIAVFSGLSEGIVSVYVSMSGFSSINTTTTLTKDANLTLGNDAAHTQFARTMVTLPRLAATLTVNYWGDWDLDGNGPEQSENYGKAITVTVTYANTWEPNVYTFTAGTKDAPASLSGLPEGTATVYASWIETITFGITPDTWTQNITFDNTQFPVTLTADQTMDLGLLEVN
ncbi:MAG: carboxypeptidase regulatory-like domain-containing protein [Bacteroidetes bacterium]|nr:carboxypeptidase regulatory-like domain-containing protein [Bacteroidota bacterium]